MMNRRTGRGKSLLAAAFLAAALAGCGGTSSVPATSPVGTPSATASFPPTASASPSPTATPLPTPVPASPTPAPGSGIFTTVPTLFGDSDAPSLVKLRDGRVLVFEADIAGRPGTLWIFDPKQGRLSQIDLPAGWPSDPSLMPLPGGLVLLFNWPAGGDPQVRLYDPSTSSLTPGGSLLGSFSGPPVLLSTGRVLLPDSPDGAMRLYDPATRRTRWLAKTHLLGDDSFPTLVALNDGRVLFAGGGDYESMLGWKSVTAHSYVFDPNTNRLTRTGSMKQARAYAVPVPLADGRVLVVGGAAPDGTPLKTAEIWDPRTGKFTSTGSLPEAASGIGVCLADGRVLFMTGHSAQIYDPRTGKFTPTGGALGMVLDAVLLDDGRVLVATLSDFGVNLQLYWP